MDAPKRPPAGAVVVVGVPVPLAGAGEAGGLPKRPPLGAVGEAVAPAGLGGAFPKRPPEGGADDAGEAVDAGAFADDALLAAGA